MNVGHKHRPIPSFTNEISLLCNAVRPLLTSLDIKVDFRTLKRPLCMTIEHSFIQSYTVTLIFSYKIDENKPNTIISGLKSMKYQENLLYIKP